MNLGSRASSPSARRISVISTFRLPSTTCVSGHIWACRSAFSSTFGPMLEQQAQQIEGLRGQMEVGLPAAQLAGLRIDGEWTEFRSHGLP